MKKNDLMEAINGYRTTNHYKPATKQWQEAADMVLRDMNGDYDDEA